jgi:small-conductance mechanosensitive channel
MSNFLETPILGNPPAAWLLAAGIVIITTLLVALLRRLLLNRLVPLRDGATLDWRGALHELAKRTLLLVAVIAGVYAASKVLNVPLATERGLATLFAIALFIQGALWADQLLISATEWKLARQPISAAAARNAFAISRFLLRVGVWTVAIVLILSNLGFDVTALVAGLGIGGIAVALAAQSVLSDLFASIAIVLDRPFAIGDFILFGDERGTVERIGIKTTRIRSISGEQIAVANTMLLASRIHNFRRMSARRIAFKLGVAYETPPDQVARMPSLFREIVNAQRHTHFERAHFRAYGPHSLIFEVVYRIDGDDYMTYLEVQQAINIEIMKRLEKEGVAFGHPDRPLVAKTSSASATDKSQHIHQSTGVEA